MSECNWIEAEVKIEKGLLLLSLNVSGSFVIPIIIFILAIWLSFSSREKETD